MNEANEDPWVIIVSASRYWHNYRHFGNGFLMYDVVKKLGVSDDHIIFLDATNSLHEIRNRHRGKVFLGSTVDEDSRNMLLAPYDYLGNDIVDNIHENVEIDYRGHEVNIQTLSRILLNEDSASRFTKDSRIFLYLTGHGGQEFLKFHDYEEMTAQYLSSIIWQMHDLELYSQMLIVLDTCQAATLLGNYITDLPNVIFASSSLINENSYGYFTHSDLGVVTYDRFTYALYQFFQRSFLQWRNEFIRYLREKNSSVAERTKGSGRGKGSSALREYSVSEAMLSLPRDFLYSTVSIQENALHNEELANEVSVLRFFSSRQFQSFVSERSNHKSESKSQQGSQSRSYLVKMNAIDSGSADFSDIEQRDLKSLIQKSCIPQLEGNALQPAADLLKYPHYHTPFVSLQQWQQYHLFSHATIKTNFISESLLPLLLLLCALFFLLLKCTQ